MIYQTENAKDSTALNRRYNEINATERKRNSMEDFL